MTSNNVMGFPFAALQGQEPLKLALLLAAIDPMLGGVLVEGPRGTAKSTAARALAAILPHGQLVNLPLGTTEEQLLGSLDVEAALQRSAVEFRPGLLAQAHQGVLYVDEVNLLADGLVDLLLDVSASGINRVERDGVSHQHPARITLIGTMNPEEGQLRPQLLDRFGLFVRLQNVPSAAIRKAIVKTRMAYDADPASFCAQYEQAQSALAAQVAAARASLAQVDWSDAIHDLVAELCQSAAVEGVRADLVILRAARAHASLQGRIAVDAADVHAVAELALTHRRTHPSEGAAQTEQQNASASETAAQPSKPTAKPLSNRQSPLPEAPQEAASNGVNSEWGAMPAPQTMGIQHVKAFRPHQTKKA